MTLLIRLLAIAATLVALFFHGLVPVVEIMEFTNPYYYSLLSGADPLITAYVDGAWAPGLLLGISTLCLLGTLIALFKGERWGASLVILAAVADAFSLHFAKVQGYTQPGFSALQIVGLGATMVVLFLLVRGGTRRV